MERAWETITPKVFRKSKTQNSRYLEPKIVMQHVQIVERLLSRIPEQYLAIVLTKISCYVSVCVFDQMVSKCQASARSRGSCKANLLSCEKQLLLSFNTNGKDTHPMWCSLPCILYTGALNTDPNSCPLEMKPRPMKTISTDLQ